MKKIMRLLLILLLIGIFSFSLWKLQGILRSYWEGDESYRQLEQYVSFAETTQLTQPMETMMTSIPTSGESPEMEATIEMPDLSEWPQVDFVQLFEINPDVVGWIYIEGTNINYPVVQASDNDYYMKRTFDGKRNSAGAIFLDAGCASDFSGKNSILYGHHMRNGSMFAGLVKYKKQAFYNEHPVALLVTPTAYYKIHLFSGYVSDNWSDAWDKEFDEETYAQWLQVLQRKSRFTPYDTPTVEEQVVTFSTCSYEFKNAKFVLHGYIAEVIPV